MSELTELREWRTWCELYHQPKIIVTDGRDIARGIASEENEALKSEIYKLRLKSAYDGAKVDHIVEEAAAQRQRYEAHIEMLARRIATLDRAVMDELED